MRRFLLALITIFLAGKIVSVRAQEPVSELDRLKVDIWPDFDRPAVLILLTGTLPGDAPSPATLTVPIPAEADVNAIARIDAVGDMYSDIEFDDSIPGQITLTTPDLRFRIEYYYPYSADGNDRSFTFSWRSDLNVEEFLTNVQQPVLANEMTLSPSATVITTGGDGMQYHDLPAASIEAGETYELEGSYTLSRPELSSAVLSAQEVPLIGADDSVSRVGESEDGFNLVLAAGVMIGVLIIAAVAWLALSNRKGVRRVVKPKPIRQFRTPPTPAASPTKKRFCHECGERVDLEDRFCRNCGAAVKKSS